jgi:hypothetical protein
MIVTPTDPSGGGGHGVSPSAIDQQICEQNPCTQRPLVHASSLVHGAYRLSTGAPVLELSSSLLDSDDGVSLVLSSALVVAFVVDDVVGSLVTTVTLLSSPASLELSCAPLLELHSPASQSDRDGTSGFE